MARDKDVHVVPHDNEWAIKRPGNSRASSVHRTQREAIDAGRSTAQRDHSELFIHNKHGQIRERNSHGYDSYSPKG